jgi:hypothetical protein
MEVGGQLRPPTILTPEKEPRYHLNRSLREHHSQSGRGGEGLPNRESNPSHLARSLANLLTERFEGNNKI